MIEKVKLSRVSHMQKDKEGNLAVLKGVGVYSLLFEYLFQDNKEDVQLLLSEKENKKFCGLALIIINGKKC